MRVVWRRAIWIGLAAGLAAMGPDSASAQIALGVRGGLNATTIAWETPPIGGGPEDLERRTAFSGGVSIAAELPGPLRIRAEALYTGKGFSEHDDSGETTRLDVDYLEVPLLLGLVASPGRRVRPEVYAGPWVGREVRCEASLEAPSVALAFPCDDVPGDPVLRRKWDFGVAVGATLALAGLGPLQAFVDVRYSAALRNVDAAPRIDNIQAKHRAFGVAAGVAWPLGS